MHEIGIEEPTMIDVYLYTKGGAMRLVQLTEAEYAKVNAGGVWRDHIPGDWYCKCPDEHHPNVPDRAEVMAKVDAAAEQLKAEAAKTIVHDGDVLGEIKWPELKDGPPKDKRRK